MIQQNDFTIPEDVTVYGPVYARGGDGGIWGFQIIDLIGDKTKLQITLEHKNKEDQNFATVGTGPHAEPYQKKVEIITVGNSNATVTNKLKELVRAKLKNASRTEGTTRGPLRVEVLPPSFVDDQS